jgi:hypothetical protein
LLLRRPRRKTTAKASIPAIIQGNHGVEGESAGLGLGEGETEGVGVKVGLGVGVGVGGGLDVGEPEGVGPAMSLFSVGALIGEIDGSKGRGGSVGGRG